jgi:hypothetical protein
MRDFTLYWSGSLRDSMESYLWEELEAPSRLIPYTEIYESRQNKKKMRGCERLVSEWMMRRACHPDVKIMFDSGAFELFRMRESNYTGPGYKIKSNKHYVDDYCKFLKKYRDDIDHYINFDHPYDWEETFKWQKYMENKGLNPLPVYHFSDPEHVLQTYIKNYDVICIGGLVPILKKPKESKRFLHNIFYIKKNFENGNGRRIKFHGLGVTNKKYFFDFPFVSADTAEMTTLAGYGKIRTSNGMYIKVSTYEKEETELDTDSTLRFDDLKEHQKKFVLTEFDELGFSLDDLADPGPKGREMRIRHFFRVMAKDIERIEMTDPKNDFFYQGSLFDEVQRKVEFGEIHTGNKKEI